MYNPGWRNLDKRLAGSVCIPASCSSDVIPMLMRQVFNETDFQLATDYSQNDFCQTNVVKEMKSYDYFVM